MKYLIVLLFLSLFLVNSCNDNATGPSGNITFTMSGQGDPNIYFFGFTPSVDAKISKILIMEAQTVIDSVEFNPNYVFSRDTIYTWNDSSYYYSGVTQGEPWNFTFTGNIASNNQNFITTSNFIIP